MTMTPDQAAEWRYRYEERLALATESGRDASQTEIDRAAEDATRAVNQIELTKAANAEIVE